MTHVFAWLVPAILGALGIMVPALLRHSNRLALLEDRMENNRRDIGNEKLRNDLQDIHLSTTDVTLARIEEGVNSIVQAMKKGGLI